MAIIFDIAKREQVSEQTITRIRDGRTWGWLKTLNDVAMVEPIYVSEQVQQEAKESEERMKKLLAGEVKLPSLRAEKLDPELEAKKKLFMGKMYVPPEGEREGDLTE